MFLSLTAIENAGGSKEVLSQTVSSAAFSEHMQAQSAPWKGLLSPLEDKGMKGSTLKVSLSAVLDKSSYD